MKLCRRPLFWLWLVASGAIIVPVVGQSPAIAPAPAPAAAKAGATARTVKPSPETEKVLKSRAPESAGELRLIQTQLQRILPQILPATVSVELGRAAGSGVIVSSDGLVLTAAHVIGRPGRQAWVELPDGRRLRAVTLGANHEADAGMLRLDSPPADLPFAPVSQGPDPERGEWVVTTGQPGGIVSDRAPPVRLGRVLLKIDDMLCTDCKLVGGDSGGPLFNMQGEVVGIHSSIGPMVTHNFHVPASSFRRDWSRLLAGELWGGRADRRSRPLLGVNGRTENGRCLVTAVSEGMPADEAGVRPGDIIAEVDGRAILTFEELADIVAFKRPGAEIRLTIDRNGERLEIVAELAAGPRDDEE